MGDIDSTKLNSIDLLEDCLNSIHRCRKNYLTDRIKRLCFHGSDQNLENIVGDRSSTQQPRVDKQREVAGTAHSLQSGACRESYPSESYASLSLHSSKYTEFQGSCKNNECADSISFSTSFLDEKAEEALVSVKEEIISWASKNPTKVDDEDARGDFADFLTEKYLCNILDPMPSSSAISRVRRQLSLDLDSFVLSGPASIPTSMCSEALEALLPHNQNSKIGAADIILPDKERVNAGSQIVDSTSAVNSKGNKKAATLSKTPHRPQNQDIALKKIEMQRQAEKTKIKDQYEKFRKLKAESEVAGRNDDIKRAEDNLDDIRSLLTSLQVSK